MGLLVLAGLVIFFLTLKQVIATQCQRIDDQLKKSRSTIVPHQARWLWEL